MTVARLSSLLWRRGGARQWTVLGLTAAGVLAATALALLALSVSPGLGARGDRIAWRTPTPAGDPATATAVQRTTSHAFRGRDITRVELAPTGRGTPPVPPGLAAFPAPGELVVSPALAELLSSEPTAALADRYPGSVVGQVGPEGRAIADDLVVVVVVGRAEGDLPVGSAVGIGPGSEAAVPVAGFATRGSDPDLADYQVMSQVAAVLLVVPTVVLVGALARLTAGQREQRLAALRLVGATPRLVVALTALEMALAAGVGAVAGAATYQLVLPFAARIPLAGAPFVVSDLRLGAGTVLAVVAVVPVLAVVSATVALTKVVIGPLGVTRRTLGRHPRLVRAASVPVAWVGLAVAADGLSSGGSITPVLLALGIVIAAFALVGPLVAWAVGAAMARLGRRPGLVLAGRRITDDPRATWRSISGMVLAGMIAGFLFGTLPTIRQADEAFAGREEALEMSVFLEGATPDTVDGAVAAAAPEARLEWGEGEPPTATLTVPRGTDPEVARTAVLRVAPDAWVSSYTDIDARATLMVDDMSRASVVMALAALGLATVATAIGLTASILDQRVTLARLRLAGTSLSVLQRARRWQAMVPLGLASIGAMASGAAAAQLLMTALSGGDVDPVPPDVPPMAWLGAAALAAGAAAVALTRPVLVAATRAAPRE